MSSAGSWELLSGVRQPEPRGVRAGDIREGREGIIPSCTQVV